MNKRRIVVGVFAVVDVVVLVILVVLLVLKANRTATLDISLVPSSAKIMINGNEYMSGAYKTYPSEKVEAVISADGFQEKTVEVELGANQTTHIHDYLMPNEDNLNYYANNPEDAAMLGTFNDEDTKKIVKILSIRNILPITVFQYGGLNGASREIVINELTGCDAYFCLLATGNYETKQQVNDLIVSKGYNPKDYKIKYEKR